MDGLSAAASVIAMVQIAQTIASAFKDYFAGVRNAREDIQRLYRSIKSVEFTLLSLHGLLNGSTIYGNIDLAVFKIEDNRLRQLQHELRSFQLLLNCSSSPTHRPVKKAMQSLIWPFKNKDIDNITFKQWIEATNSCMWLNGGGKFCSEVACANANENHLCSGFRKIYPLVSIFFSLVVFFNSLYSSTVVFHLQSSYAA